MADSTQHGWVRGAVKAGIAAGLVGALVLIVIRLTLAVGFLLVLPFAIRSYLTRSLPPFVTSAARSQIWAALKLSAYPFVGQRALAPGFDIGVILLGLATMVIFSICVGVVFGLIAHGRSAKAIVALGVLCGIGTWAVNYRLINPAIGPVVIEYIPYGLTIASGFLCHRWLFPPRRP